MECGVDDQVTGAVSARVGETTVKADSAEA
jgi:hypothetical protein